MQSSFKFNMLHSAKSQLVRFYSMRQGAKTKNHYDTLKITPHATQNEIKSAYYKLTLQYHPDKNKSEYAKQKFQNISEAYQVLGNYQQRKIYDRGMLLHQQPSSGTAKESTSYYNDKVYSGSSKIYNFDAWVQAHYGKQRKAEYDRRRAYENYKAEKIAHSNDNPRFTTVVIFLFTLAFIASYMCQERLDIRAPAKHKRESKDN